MLDKAKKILKKNKNEIICGIILFIVQCIILIPWLKGHMSGDDYTIANIGYKEYIKNFSLNDGRIFAGWMIATYDLLNLNIETSATISLIVSIIICSISIVFLKKMIENIHPSKNIFSQITVTVISFVTIFNFMNIDCLYFIEGAVIEGSGLLALIAVDILISENKHCNLKALIIIAWAVFTYQATVFIAIPVTVLFTVAKYKGKGSIKKIIINLIKICIFVFIAMILNILTMKFYSLHIGLNRTRANVNIERMKSWIEFVFKHIDIIFLDNFNYFIPDVLLFLLIFMLIFLIIHAINHKNKDTMLLILKYFLVEAFFFLCNEVVFVITNSSRGSGRMNLCLGMMVGIGLIFIYTVINLYEKKNVYKIAFIIIAIIYLISIIYKTEEIIVNISQAHQMDKQSALKICTYIEQYEKNNNKKIVQINELIVKNKPYKGYYENTKVKNKITNSIIKTRRDASAMINYYKKDKLRTKYIFKNNEDSYEKQYFCEDNTLNLVIFNY